MSTVEPFHLNPKRVYNSPFTNYHLRLTITSTDHAWIRHLSGEKNKGKKQEIKSIGYIYIDVPSLKLLLDSILSDDLVFFHQHLKYSRIECWTDSLDSSRIEDGIFVFRNSLFEKSLFKLSCICLPLKRLVNGKHFPVNENTFRSTKNTFQSKKNLVWFSGKCFPFWLCLFFKKWFPGNHFPNFPVFVCH